ncbi:MAG: YceI family protein, partial [Pyrinomonadaceae bacterium]
MKIFRNSLAVAIVTALVLAIFGLAMGRASVRAEAETQDTVNYLPIPAGTYKLDPPHTLVGFSIRHLEINWVEGRFKDISGTINFDDKDITRSSVEFSAKTNSVDTGVAARDAHLKTADFFDAAKYPEMTFKSTKVEEKGKGYVLSGDLTIKGVTK